MKKLFLLLLSCLLTLSLSGCQFPAFDSDSLMNPPKAAGDGQEIQEALDRVLGTDYTLRYPRSGTNRSAIIRADLDADDIEEALVFYRTAADTSGARLSVMDKNDADEWNVTYSISGEGSEVERVLFTDCDGDGGVELIIGWQTYTGSNILAAYKYTSGQLVSIPATETAEATGVTSRLSYSELIACDIDSDGRGELFIASIDSINSKAIVKMVRYGLSGSSGELTVATDIDLSPSITAFSGSGYGKVYGDTTGIYFSCYRGSASSSTELLLWDSENERLEAPFSALDEPFLRTRDTQAIDIDADGIMEFATDVPLPSFSMENSETLYLTTWHSYNPEEKSLAVEEFTCIEFPDKGYSVFFTKEWSESITAQRDTSDDTVYFYSHSESDLGEELFRIKLFSVEEWEDLPEPENDESEYVYRELYSDSYSVYAVLISAVASDYDITFETVKDSFLLNS
ncbi:MAG: hypothetical protein E7546_05660 [Ruminococcaceae bacterium]|nr:hypothetical protein [Oscillospiraceae bacterium]